MRKNKMMRAASALMVAVLLTTCTISGTFAKYVTTAEGYDTARVAKWGVEVSGIAQDVFKTTYDTSVVSSNTDKLVAPGTKNGDGVTFKLTGKPEVSVRVKVEVGQVNDSKEFVAGNFEEVFLPASTYIDYTKATGVDKATGKAVYGDTFTVEAPGYYPVVFTLIDTANPGTPLIKGTLADIQSFLAMDKTYGPNQDLATIYGGTSGTYKLTWEWVFGTEEFGKIANVDKADTYLGNVAAGTVTDAKAITNINFAIKVTVEQVD